MSIHFTSNHDLIAIIFKITIKLPSDIVIASNVFYGSVCASIIHILSWKNDRHLEQNVIFPFLQPTGNTFWGHHENILIIISLSIWCVQSRVTHHALLNSKSRQNCIHCVFGVSILFPLFSLYFFYLFRFFPSARKILFIFSEILLILTCKYTNFDGMDTWYLFSHREKILTAVTGSPSAASVLILWRKSSYLSSAVRRASNVVRSCETSFRIWSEKILYTKKCKCHTQKII